MSIIFLIIGLVLLVKGADFFVEGSSSIAKRFNIPSMVIGLTLVAFGTSAPELAVSVREFMSGRDLGSGEKLIAQTLEKLDVNAAAAERERPGLTAAFEFMKS